MSPGEIMSAGILITTTVGLTVLVVHAIIHDMRLNKRQLQRWKERRAEWEAGRQGKAAIPQEHLRFAKRTYR